MGWIVEMKQYVSNFFVKVYKNESSPEPIFLSFKQNFFPCMIFFFPACYVSSQRYTIHLQNADRGYNYADINRLSCFRNQNRGLRNAWREPETPEALKARDRQGAPASSITGGCRKYQKPLILKRLETATWFCRNVAIGTWKGFWWNAFLHRKGVLL